MTIPIGGSQVTSDISIMKNIAFETAEKIKIDAGSCWEGAAAGDDDIIVPGMGGRPPLSIPRYDIEEIIRPRIEEIFVLVREKLGRLALNRPLGGGIVLTGGGAQLLGAAELASLVFKLPVRIGAPLSMGGLVEEYRNPVYATAVGLVLEGFEREGMETEKTVETREKGTPFLGKITDWFKKEFF
jgi:cell division protein FtsA